MQYKFPQFIGMVYAANYLQFFNYSSTFSFLFNCLLFWRYWMFFPNILRFIFLKLAFIFIKIFLSVSFNIILLGDFFDSWIGLWYLLFIWENFKATPCSIGFSACIFHNNFNTEFSNWISGQGIQLSTTAPAWEAQGNDFDFQYQKKMNICVISVSFLCSYFYWSRLFTNFCWIPETVNQKVMEITEVLILLQRSTISLI